MILFLDRRGHRTALRRASRLSRSLSTRPHATCGRWHPPVTGVPTDSRTDSSSLCGARHAVDATRTPKRTDCMPRLAPSVLGRGHDDAEARTPRGARGTPHPRSWGVGRASFASPHTRSVADDAHHTTRACARVAPARSMRAPATSRRAQTTTTRTLTYGSARRRQLIRAAARSGARAPRDIPCSRMMTCTAQESAACWAASTPRGCGRRCCCGRAPRAAGRGRRP